MPVTGPPQSPAWLGSAALGTGLPDVSGSLAPGAPERAVLDGSQ